MIEICIHISSVIAHFSSLYATYMVMFHLLVVSISCVLLYRIAVLGFVSNTHFLLIVISYVRIKSK